MKEILALMPRPSRYLGIEEGTVKADPASARLHCALAFPDLYEIAMSYLGQKILYGQINAMDGVLAERVFSPCREGAEVLRKHGVRLATLESDTDLADVHFLGFSITHELCFTNVLLMLDLAAIPLYSADRGEDLKQWPLVVAGGGCTICAEPLAPFMDLMVIGESEAVLPALLPLLMKAREEGWTRTAFLQEARHIPGVYVPSFFKMREDGSLEALYEDYTEVKRRPVTDMKDAFYPTQQVTPFGAVHNRLSLEIARGCTRGCRFCQAGMTLRPSRERSIDELKALLEDCLAKTGYDDVSFLSLSCGDFSGLKTMFLDVAERCASEQIAISLPSLRVGSVDGDIMARMADIRRTGATIAPEAGSQRLRDVINKGVTEEALIHHVRQLAGYGWQQVKLYFMIGLPTETREDLAAIVELCAKVRDCCRKKDEKGKWYGPRLTVTAALSPFVPKTHTPFQWEPQISMEEMKERIYFVRDLVRQEKGVSLRWHEPAMSHLEGVLSRGDRRLAPVIEKAYRKGGIFASWVEGFQLQPWMEALEECGMRPEEWTCGRDLDSVLAWDHLNTGVSKNYLLKERERAIAEKVSGDCRYEACRNCGVCDTKAGPSLLRISEADPEIRTQLNFPQRDQIDFGPIPEIPRFEPGRKKEPPHIDEALVQRVVRYRVWHHKEGGAAWISQLELQSLLERALRRAGLPMSFTQGFHPLPRLSFGRALPVGVGSMAEWFMITLRQPMSEEEVLSRLAPVMLEGMAPVRAELMPLFGKLIMPAEELFRLRVSEKAVLREPERLKDWKEHLAADWAAVAASDTLNLERVNKKGKTKVENLRPLLAQHEARPNGDIFLTLNWRDLYLSPLTVIKAVSPWLGDADIDMYKLAQYFDDNSSAAGAAEDEE